MKTKIEICNGGDMFKIDKNIPAPELGCGTILYPFRQMGIGDSFFVPFNGRSPRRVVSSVCASSRKNRMGDMKFTTRTIKGEDGCRCWRIE